jgi:amino acid transporter
MGSAIFFGLTCPANAEGLVGGESRALKSPMTIAIQQAGWLGGVHLINAFILFTCLSAINSSIYIASRTVLHMAQTRMAPKFLGYTNGRGVPVFAIILTNLVGALSMMNLSTGASKAYSYIVNLSGVSTFLVWGSISFTHIRFRRAWAAQGRTPEELPFRAMAWPWVGYFGFAANCFLALVQGWGTLAPFDAGNFVDAYILLPLFPIIFVIYKFWNKTTWHRATEIDLDAGRRRDLDDKVRVVEESVAGSSERLSWWKRIWASF